MLLFLVGVGWLGLKCAQTGWFFIGTMGYVLMFMGWGLPALVLILGISMAAFKSSSTPSTVPIARTQTATPFHTRSVAPNIRSTAANVVRPPEVVLPPLIRAKSKISAMVDQHLEALARKRLAMVSVDDYGIVQGSAWNKEVQYFVDKVVRPALTEAEANAVAGVGMSALFQELVEDRVAQRADEIEAELNFDAVKTPLDFERWCARVLSANGWATTVTKGSGDQGADVLARKDGELVVLQCKLYTGAVGNKAVQEAFSAQRHYIATRSAVVTNAEFTRSAYELSRTTKVLLLHYSDLNRLDTLMK
jgi:restriction system protein